jgi:hypothetical protein
MASGGIDVTDEHAESFPGLVERLGELERQGVDEATIARQVEATAAAAGVSIHHRGLSDVIAWIRDRRSRRQLVEDLGEHDAEVPSFGFHVPPHGAAALTFERAVVGQQQVSVGLVGIGMGGSLTVRYSVVQRFPQRRTCARFIEHVTARTRVYSIGPDDPLEPVTDVVRQRFRELRSWPDCPFCGIPPDAVDTVDFEVGKDGFDHRRDETGHDEDRQLSIESTLNARVGWPLPSALVAVPIEGGLTATVTTRFTCTVRWVFPAGHLLVPYRPLGQPRALPYWAAA